MIQYMSIDTDNQLYQEYKDVMTDQQQVECLDKIALVKYDRGVWLLQFTKELAGHYPKVHKQYVISEHWQEYKRKLVADTLERKRLKHWLVPGQVMDYDHCDNYYYELHVC